MPLSYKIGDRERLLIAVFIIVITLGTSYNKFYKPNKEQIAEIRGSLDSLMIETAKTEIGIQDVEREIKELEEGFAKQEEIKNRLAELQKKIPYQEQVSTLLKFLTDTEGHKEIDFISIKPGQPEEQKRYLLLPIEIELVCSYSALINYIHILENLSPYLSIADVNIASEKEGYYQLEGAVRITALFLDHIRDAHKADIFLYASPLTFAAGECDFFKPLILPEALKLKPVAELKLTGIIRKDNTVRAIIDNKIVKVGDSVAGRQVVDISKDEAVLEDTTGRHLFKIEKEGKAIKGIIRLNEKETQEFRDKED